MPNVTLAPLSLRKLTDEEVREMLASQRISPIIDQLVGYLRDIPFDPAHPAGISIGPFRSEAQARNLRPYLTQATRVLGWGEGAVTRSGHRQPCIRVHAVRNHADWDLHIVRTRA